MNNTFQNENENSLTHYGVLGMKWGVRRGNVSGAYSKATKKRAKLEGKVEKYRRKKLKYANPIIRTEISDALYRNNARKEDKYRAKAEKWAKSMEKTFKDYEISKMSDNNVELGKNFVKKLVDE